MNPKELAGVVEIKMLVLMFFVISIFVLCCSIEDIHGDLLSIAVIIRGFVGFIFIFALLFVVVGLGLIGWRRCKVS